MNEEKEEKDLLSVYDEMDDVVTDLEGISSLLFHISESENFYNYNITAELLYLSKCVKEAKDKLTEIGEKMSCITDGNK